MWPAYHFASLHLLSPSSSPISLQILSRTRSSHILTNRSTLASYPYFQSSGLGGSYSPHGPVFIASSSALTFTYLLCMLFGRFYVLLFLVVLVDFGFGFWSAVLCVFCKLLTCLLSNRNGRFFFFPFLFLFWIMALRMFSPSYL